eukprot:CAMPEP_0182417102 /NCGR_PEP_ID=MMETSP1167-20130531/1518_1 /TAXON_ID=2988 /ORGANISM="Mallomonas Sp, Strain CCMP3275" /LENGTH=306 /DNA_ID=CAMNT_0024590409 /DNA_START=303 /DNA_END=1219 /DNA_ORIENTATION=-
MLSRMFETEISDPALWFAKSIIDLHNGSISVISDKIGKKKVFLVDLPIVNSVSDEVRDRTQTHEHNSHYSVSLDSSLVEIANLPERSRSGIPQNFFQTSYRHVCQWSHRVFNREAKISDEEIVAAQASVVQEDKEVSEILPVNPVTDHEEVLVTRALNPLNINTTRPQKEMSAIKRILIVDDAPISRRMLHRIVNRSCNFIDEAVDGVDAVNKYKASVADGRPYTLILMDFQMPNLNGPMATHQIRKMGFIGPIIGVTGNVLPNDIDYFMEKGASKVLLKPLSIESLEQTISDELIRSEWSKACLA